MTVIRCNLGQLRQPTERVVGAVTPHEDQAAAPLRVLSDDELRRVMGGGDIGSTNQGYSSGAVRS
jgi:hypothetical protein